MKPPARWTHVPKRASESPPAPDEGRTSFVIAHRLSTIRDADNVIVINEGEIVEQGSHQQLLEKRGFFHHLYMGQFKGQEI